MLTREAMEKLTTKRLLAYKTTLLAYPEGPYWVEFASDNLKKNGPPPRMHKQQPEWQANYAEVKSILATREHIER